MNKEENYLSSGPEGRLSPTIGNEAVGYPARIPGTLDRVNAAAPAWPSHKPVLQAKTGNMVSVSSLQKKPTMTGGVIQRQEDKNADILTRLGNAPKFELDLDDDIKAEPQKQIVLSGHGSWKIEDGTFRVPIGVTLYFYARHADPTYNHPTLDKLAMQGKTIAGAVPAVEIVRSGQMTYDYTLHPEDRAIRNVKKSRGNARHLHRVSESVKLSQLLAQRRIRSIGDVHWHACRVVEGNQWFFTPTGAIVHESDILHIEKKHKKEAPDTKGFSKNSNLNLKELLKHEGYIDNDGRRTGIELDLEYLGYKIAPKALRRLVTLLESSRGDDTNKSILQQIDYERLNQQLLDPTEFE